jgi:hypothetical protein
MVMYFFDSYLWEALKGRAADYLAFSHAGHGINSYSLNYHLIDGPLVLMVQTPFGGAYAGAAEPTRVAAQFERCAALIAAVDGAKARGLSARQGRLIVFESELRGRQVCGWLDSPVTDDATAKSWALQHQVDSSNVGDGQVRRRATTAAREWLEAGSFNEPVDRSAHQHYPDRKTRELTDQEKDQIRKRLESGEGTEAVAEDLRCAKTQVAAIKAWLKR